MKSLLKNIWLLGLCAGMSLHMEISAQTNTNKTQSKPGTKPSSPAKKTAPVSIMPDTIKVPRFTTRFGPYNGSTPAPAEDLKKITAGDLVVFDQRGQQWTVVAWRFIWNKKEYSDDIRTGKRKLITTYNIVEVDSTAKLPSGWQNELKEFLQPGEEIRFERIIIEHPASRRRMFATDLIIRII